MTCLTSVSARSISRKLFSCVDVHCLHTDGFYDEYLLLIDTESQNDVCQLGTNKTLLYCQSSQSVRTKYLEVNIVGHVFGDRQRLITEFRE
jgi:hypothetical protein